MTSGAAGPVGTSLPLLLSGDRSSRITQNRLRGDADTFAAKQVQEGKKALSFLRSQMALYGKQKAGG